MVVCVTDAFNDYKGMCCDARCDYAYLDIFLEGEADCVYTDVKNYCESNCDSVLKTYISPNIFW